MPAVPILFFIYKIVIIQKNIKIGGSMITKEEREMIKKHCLENNLKYSNILRRIRYQLNKNNTKEKKTTEEILNIVVERYKNRQLNNAIKNNLDKLKVVSTNKEYREICNNLKINWKHILKLSYNGYDKKELILYFWYFYDKIEDGMKDISRKRLREIKDSNKLINNDIYYLISYYKCGKKSFLEEILYYEEKYLNKIATSVSYKFKLTSTEREDLISEAKLIFIEILEKITLNNIRQIICYIRIVLFGRLTVYAKENYQRITKFDEEYMYMKEEFDECVMI